ncbi:SusC/RagA family TonB-linked outer membrane protein [Arenibacter certesii]|uniref:SusC/RagA family TonB-linked outer membrane protein n=1 Tax=Arenibacter certesii TaxID=228955 RepID=A0A918MQE0_9FLAO|nr:TonB-dependent receptor [Arenibacter certesii]GGW50543.1 SusC/RagA family TonB-linked outer membrane protein [Arenibacter certesii]
MKKMYFLLLGMCFGAFSFLSAQTLTVSGTVTDANSVPIFGVNILEKNTNNGVVSDFDGNYTIIVNDPNGSLVFSYLGMKTVELKLEGRNQLNLIMEEDAANLEEVVVIGYGTSTRRDLTGSITSVSVENTPIALQPTTNVLQMLQGTTPGVNIGAISSAGGSPDLLIRGQNSINASNAPLIVLDGVIFDGSLNTIPNDDIATIDVLKDASSSAIYGSRAANGVIIITTKKGRSDKPTISFNHYTGVQDWTRVPEMKKGGEFIRWRRDNLELQGTEDLTLPQILSPKEYKAYNEGHQLNWFDEVTQFAPIQNYQMSVSGRTDKTNYYISGGLLNQHGVLDNDNYEKFNLTAKLDNDITNWLSIGLNMYYDSSDYSGASPQMSIATWYTPYSYKYIEGYDDVLDRYPTNSFLYNPYWGQPQFGEAGYYDDDLDKRWGIRGSGFLDIDIPFIKGLSYRLDYTQSRRVNDQGFFHHEFGEVNTDNPEEIENPDRFLNKAYGYKRTDTGNSWVLNNLLKYNNTFGDHRIDVLLGYTRDKTINEMVEFSGSDFSDAGTSVLGFYGLDLADPTKKGGKTSISEFSNVGYLSRINYSFNNKYHLTATYRRDGYSAFAEGSKFGGFPGVSVAWTVSEEGFMRNTLPKFEYLKLRASYGKNGNQGIGPYQTLANVGGGQTVFGDQTFNYSYPSSLANKSLSWETTTALNLGANFSFLDGRISGDIDLYKSETTDLLLNRNLPIITGYNSVRTNLGRVDNKGIEVTLNTINIKTPEFQWGTGVVFSLNRNKIASITGLDADGDGFEDDDIGNRWFIGKSLGAVYDYTVDGIVQTEDTEYINTYGFQPGDLKIRDINGEDEEGNLTGQPDGQITAADRSIIGYTAPNFRANMSNTLTYKNFQFYFDLNFVAGGGKDNYYLAQNRTAFQGTVPTVGNWLAGREYWMPDNQSNKVPRPNYGNPFGYGFWQSREFLRLQNVSLAYNFDNRVKDLLGVNELKLYVSGKNLFTKTNWVGLDPENAGTIGSSNPVMRTFTLGVNLSF